MHTSAESLTLSEQTGGMLPWQAGRCGDWNMGVPPLQATCGAMHMFLEGGSGGGSRLEVGKMKLKWRALEH